jgi:hypothetical protein
LTLLSGRDFLGLKGIVEALLARFHREAELEVRPGPIRRAVALGHGAGKDRRDRPRPARWRRAVSATEDGE